MSNESSLRQRKSGLPPIGPSSLSKEAISDGRAEDIDVDKKETISYGKTLNGKVFRVPQTHDMVSTLFDVRQRKSTFDLITLSIMLGETILFFTLPLTAKRIFFTVLFLLWRTGYNVGLGYLLNVQSKDRRMVQWAKKYAIFDEKKRPEVYRWLKRELSAKMGSDYDFVTAPIEYNTWLLYRQLVDIILMNDFTAYMCFVLSWINLSPQNSNFLLDVLRWVGGILMILFNVWVKLDAHRVVKDFAWYWGDFFFLIEQSLTFDGVFEMAPHPMYSVGYAGYYGLSLISASYTVLFVSLLAHAMQMAFLMFVEEPHIQKTYNPPSTPMRRASSQMFDLPPIESASPTVPSFPASARDNSVKSFRRDLIVFKNFDWFRSTDLALALLVSYAVFVPTVCLSHGRDDMTIKKFAIGQALFWRCFHTYGLGAILWMQSRSKFWTRHFIKWGATSREAWANWRTIYNMSLCMTYVSFFTACWTMYTLPSDWTYGTTLLRHTLGVMFILLHIWTSASIYEVLGDFGWFYGDFFIDGQPSGLLYTGIYRFLNNPEKIMGHAAFWGMTMIANSWQVFALAVFSQISNFLFINYVESPHMRKLYGSQMRKDAGLTKTLKTSLQSARTAIPKTIPAEVRAEINKIIAEKAELQQALARTKQVERAVKETVEKVEKVVEETAENLGELFEAAKPRLQEMVIETRLLIDTSRSRILPRVSENIDMNDLHAYALEFPTTSPTRRNATIPHSFTLGTRIEICWKAPMAHADWDWIGVYKVTANKNKLITDISSRGYWRWVSKPSEGEKSEDTYDKSKTNSGMTSGKLVFEGDVLPWEVGTYEFRYHHDGKHNVMAISTPFEITAPHVPDQLSVASASMVLLPICQAALNYDPNVIPNDVAEEFLLMPEKSAKRIVYAIKVLFGVEFAWEVIETCQSVYGLATRILDAKQALVPFTSQTKRI